jgi:hypothetical protein
MKTLRRQGDISTLVSEKMEILELERRLTDRIQEYERNYNRLLSKEIQGKQN